MPASPTEPAPRAHRAEATDTPAIRHGGPEPLSLALMDTRNHLLQLLTLAEQPKTGESASLALRWLAGHTGWFAESWIGRNPQRHQGVACPPRPVRLASLEAHADAWWREPGGHVPDGERTRAYLLEQLESTLELLEKAPRDDAGLYFYRMAVLHEDLRGEEMLVRIQQHGLPVVLALPDPRRLASPLAMPRTRWQMGVGPEGFAWDHERGPHAVELPEFEIDAQAVSWSQFVEFVDDGGYDRAELWHPEGWTWLEQRQAEDEGRRGPRYVEQIGVASGAVMQQRFGRAVRMAGHHSAMHVSWWEADAWCRWAGRRLPTEAEWECAAITAARRGFDWGQVHEWMAGTLRPWPGHVAGPWAEYGAPWFGRARVLRGASFATRGRLRDPRFRGFAPPDDDLRFVGFRSCAL